MREGFESRECYLAYTWSKEAETKAKAGRSEEKKREQTAHEARAGAAAVNDTSRPRLLRRRRQKLPDDAHPPEALRGSARDQGPRRPGGARPVPVHPRRATAPVGPVVRPRRAPLHREPARRRALRGHELRRHQGEVQGGLRWPQRRREDDSRRHPRAGEGVRRGAAAERVRRQRGHTGGQGGAERESLQRYVFRGGGSCGRGRKDDDGRA